MPESSDTLYEKFTTLRSLFGDYHKEVEQNRKYYNRDFAADLVPDKWQGRLTPLIPQTARRSIDEPADHILTYPFIKVPVRPTLGDESGEQARAEVVRQACNAFWGHISRTNNILGDARKPLLNEGKIAVRKTLRWDALPDYPDRADYNSGGGGTRSYNNSVAKYKRELEELGRSEFLWNIELLDNVTVFEDPSDHRDPKYVFVSYRIYVEEAKERWPWIEGSGLPKPSWHDKQDFDEVEYTEYWSKPGPVKNDKSWEPGKFCQWVEDHKVHETDNPYPYIPIVIEDAGFGLVHQLAKPADKFVGMTQHARELFRAQAESRTSWLAVSRMSAFPMGKGRNLPEDKEINLGPGEIINFEGDENTPGSEDLEWMEHPDIQPGVIALGETLEEEANSTFKMNILSGTPQRGVDTATEADMNVRNAVSKLSGPIGALERVIVKLTRQMLMDVELVLRAPVTLYGASAKFTTPAEIVLKPTDIGRFYEVHAQLSTSDQEVMEQSNARFWLEAYRINPIISAQTALERGEVVDDVQAEFIRRAGEDVFLSEPMTMARIQAAAADLGMVLQAAAAAEQGGGGAAGDESMFGARADQTFDPAINQEQSGLQQQTVDAGLARRDIRQGASQLR